MITYILELVNPYGNVEYVTIKGLSDLNALDIARVCYPNCAVNLVEDKSYESKFTSENA